MARRPVDCDADGKDEAEKLTVMIDTAGVLA